MPAACASAPTTYRHREPDQAALHGAIREHLGTVLAAGDVPGHVRRALRRYLDCGMLVRGFVRVRCPQCKAESIVAGEFIRRYNEERLHSGIGYVTPKTPIEDRHEAVFAERDRKLDEARQRRAGLRAMARRAATERQSVA